jgi:hypothetical protein
LSAFVMVVAWGDSTRVAIIVCLILDTCEAIVSLILSTRSSDTSSLATAKDF